VARNSHLPERAGRKEKRPSALVRPNFASVFHVKLAPTPRLAGIGPNLAQFAWAHSALRNTSGVSSSDFGLSSTQMVAPPACCSVTLKRSDFGAAVCSGSSNVKLSFICFGPDRDQVELVEHQHGNQNQQCAGQQYEQRKQVILDGPFQCYSNSVKKGDARYSGGP
jgi:hypothetical protein